MSVNTGVLDELVSEASTARRHISELYPPVGATPHEVLQALQKMRPYMDEIERHLVTARRVRRTCEQAVIRCKGSAEDRWDQAARGKGSAVRDGGPRERYAHFNLEAIEERMVLREAEQVYAHAVATFDAIQTLYRGADGMRHDLHVMVRAATFESSLER